MCWYVVDPFQSNLVVNLMFSSSDSLRKQIYIVNVWSFLLQEIRGISIMFISQLYVCMDIILWIKICHYQFSVRYCLPLAMILLTKTIFRIANMQPILLNEKCIISSCSVTIFSAQLTFSIKVATKVHQIHKYVYPWSSPTCQGI